MQPEIANGFRLSPQQRRLWALLQGDPGSGYHSQVELLLEGPLDRGRLATSLSGLVGRHEVLRTVFRRLPGMALPLQVVEPEQLLLPQVCDLSALPAQQQERELEAL